MALSMSQSFSQSVVLTGTVTDNNDNPLVGATIAVVGGRGNSTTDASGITCGNGCFHRMR